MITGVYLCLLYSCVCCSCYEQCENSIFCKITFSSSTRCSWIYVTFLVHVLLNIVSLYHESMKVSEWQWKWMINNNLHTVDTISNNEECTINRAPYIWYSTWYIHMIPRLYSHYMENTIIGCPYSANCDSCAITLYTSLNESAKCYTVISTNGVH